MTSEDYLLQKAYTFLPSDSPTLGFFTGIQLSLMDKHYLPCITSHTLFSASCVVIFLKRKHAVSFAQGTIVKLLLFPTDYII